MKSLFALLLLVSSSAFAQSGTYVKGAECEVQDGNGMLVSVFIDTTLQDPHAQLLLQSSSGPDVILKDVPVSEEEDKTILTINSENGPLIISVSNTADANGQYAGTISQAQGDQSVPISCRTIEIPGSEEDHEEVLR